jgi:hypothetical protein
VRGNGARSVEADVRALRAGGYVVDAEEPHESFQRAIVRREARRTRIEWVFDSAFREFPKLQRHFGSVKGAWPRIVGQE